MVTNSFRIYHLFLIKRRMDKYFEDLLKATTTTSTTSALTVTLKGAAAKAVANLSVIIQVFFFK